MRQLLALVLLAGTAAPALAAGGPAATIQSMSDRQERREARAQARSERSEARAERSGGDDSARVVRSNRVERPSGDAERPQPSIQLESNSGGAGAGQRLNRGLRGRMTGGEAPAIQPIGGDESPPAQIVRTSRGPRVIEAPQVGDDAPRTPTLRQQSGTLPRVFRDRVPIVSSTPREGTQPAHRTESRRTNWASWSTGNWRRDHRYNWREHRRRHRSLFHLGFYYDPFGWNYRPYQIGWRLWPSYYSSRFWLNDPWQYRLPYAPPGYRWIRYHDDAILVDTWNGQVVDVIHNFFW